MLRGSSKTALRLSLMTALAIALFCTPLLIRYRYFKAYSVTLTSSDVVAVNKRMSSVWCEAQNLSMKSPFSAYLLPDKPPVSRLKRKYSYNERLLLPSGSTEIWGFFLLEESVLTVRACPKKRGATITIIKGKDVLMQCLEYHAKHLNDEESLESSESSETAEEIDDKLETHESTVSSSEGVNSNETEGHEFECKGALQRQEYKKMPTCFPSHSWLPAEEETNRTRLYDEDLSFKLTAKTSDRYYVVFSSSHPELDGMPLPNEIYAKFQLDRRTYNLSQAYRFCSNSNGSSCVFDVPWGRRGFVVVEFERENPGREGPLSSDVLVSFCQPRQWLYFIFYLLLFLLIFVCAFQ